MFPRTGVQLEVQGSAAFGRDLDSGANAVTSFEGAIVAASGGVSAVGTVITGALLGIGLAAVSAFAQASQAVMSFVGTTISSNAQFEGYRVSLGVLLGSVEAAQQRINELAQFANITPFELPQIIAAERLLISFGLASVDAKEKFGFSAAEIRTIVGDMASGVQQDFGTIAAYIGRFSAGATGEAIQRFTEMGVTSRAELKAIGIEFSAAGGLVTPLGEATTKLLTLMKEKFGGMMLEQSKTFTGMTSTLNDWVSTTMRTLGEPIFDAFKVQLEILLTLLNSPAVANFITQLGTGLASAVSSVMTVVQPLLTWVQSFIAGLGEGKNPIDMISYSLQQMLPPWLLSIWQQFYAGAMGLFRFLGANSYIVTDLAKWIGGVLTSALSAAGDAIKPLTDWVVDFLVKIGQGQDPLTLLGDALMNLVPEPLIPVVKDIQNVLASLVNFVVANLPAVGRVFNVAWASILVIFDAVSKAVSEELLPAFATIWGETNVKMPDMQEIVTRVLVEITKAIVLTTIFITQVLIPAFVQVVQWVAANWPAIQEVIGQVMAQVNAYMAYTPLGIIIANWTTIQTTITGVLTAIGTFVQTTVAAIAAWWQENGTTVIANVTTTWATIQTNVAAGIAVVEAFIQTALAAIQGWWTEHGDSVMVIVDALWTFISEQFTSKVEAIQMIVGGALLVISQIWSVWGDTILAVASNIWDLIVLYVDNATKNLGDIIDAISAAIQGDWTTFGEELKSIWERSWAFIGEVLNTAKETFLLIVGQLITNVIAAWNTTDWAGIGSAIVNGIITGIQSMAATLANAAAGAAQAALDAAQAALGIQSPSKVAAAKVGVPFSEGIAQGIMSASGLVSQAAVGVTQAAIAPPATATQSTYRTSNVTRNANVNMGGVNVYNQTDVSALRAFILQTVQEAL